MQGIRGSGLQRPSPSTTLGADKQRSGSRIRMSYIDLLSVCNMHMWERVSRAD